MKGILEQVASGRLSIGDAERLLKANGISEVENFAKLDIHREVRKGIPEVILAEGKKPSQLAKIVERLLEAKGRVIISRAGPEHMKALESLEHLRDRPGKQNGILVFKQRTFVSPRTGGRVGILTAGTSDLGVAEEAEIVAEEMGCSVYLETDVGVAGIHRVFPAIRRMVKENVDVIIVAAGREGALPTVVSGLVDMPIIGLPISTGYGVGGHGRAALTSMLQACSLGIAVVNIDAGVAAGAVAGLIANRAAKSRSELSTGNSDKLRA